MPTRQLWKQGLSGPTVGTVGLALAACGGDDEKTPANGESGGGGTKLERKTIGFIGSELRAEIQQRGLESATSSALDELAALCDRVLVLRGGAIAAEIAGQDVTEKAVVSALFLQDGDGELAVDDLGAVPVPTPATSESGDPYR